MDKEKYHDRIIGSCTLKEWLWIRLDTFLLYIMKPLNRLHAKAWDNSYYSKRSRHKGEDVL